MSGFTIHRGDCIEVLAAMPAESVDAIVCDPPYGLGFMGKAWDDLPPGLPWAQECLRVLKPGGHLLAFGGTRTWHRLAVAVEDAGFEMRDSIAWLYGSGFPKSLDVSKAIDRAAGAEREVVGSKLDLPGYHLNGHNGGEAFGHGLSSSTYETRLASSQVTAPATSEAEQWQGWGTALKPAFEPIVVARKPFKGNVAANVLQHGTGALNIDACRIDTNGETWPGNQANAHENYSGKVFGKFAQQYTKPSNPAGRWPANVVLDDSQAAALDEQSGNRPGFSGGGATAGEVGNDVYGKGWQRRPEPSYYSDSGGASRFFYCAKAPKKERPVVDGVAHSTVKPLTLMRWLVRLVTPPGGTVLDPFAGSGTTVEAALLEGFDVIGIEREADYHPLIQVRIRRALGLA